MTKTEKWECDGCGKLFDKAEIVESIQLPYYVCQTCENELIKEIKESEEK